MTPEAYEALAAVLERLRTRVLELQHGGPGQLRSSLLPDDEARRWLADVGRLLCETLDLAAVAERIALGARVLLRAKVAAVFGREPELGHAVAVAASGALTSGPGSALSVGLGGLLDLVARERRPMTTSSVVDDARVAPPAEAGPDGALAGCRSVLALPLLAQDRVIGVLGVGDDEGRRFTEAEIEIARTFADQGALALEHARLYGEARRRLEHTETLLNVSRVVSSTLDLTEAMRRVARETCRALGADMVGAFVPDADARSLRPIAGYRVPKPLLARFVAEPIPLAGHPILEEAWAQRRPVWSSDVAADPRVDQATLRRFPHRSDLFFPIVIQGAPVGAFFVAWFEKPHAFTPEEIRLVEGISHQAALALENARLHEQTWQRLRQAETLLAVSQAITSALDLTEVVRRTTRELVRALGADFGVAYHYGRDRSEVAPIAGYRIPKELLKAPPAIPREALEAIVSEPEGAWDPIVSSDSAADPRFDHPAARVIAHRSLLIVRMRAHDEVIGGFSVVWTRERHRFAPEELRLAEAIARQAAVAVENARALESERALERRQNMLMALGRELSAEIELPRLLQRVAARSADLLGTDAALLLLLEGEDLLFRGAIGIEDAVRAIGRLRVDTSLTGVVVRERRPLVCPDLTADATWRDTPLVRRFGYRAMLAVPLVYRGRTLGVLKLLHREPRLFDADDVAFLEAIATEAGMAIENARLLEEATRGRQEAEAIADVARTVNASLDLDTTLEQVTRAARRLCGSDVAAIALREPGTERMAIRYPIGSAWQGVIVEPGKGSGGHVLATRQPFRTSDYAHDPRITRDYLAAVAEEGAMVQLVVPIVKDERIEGLLYVGNRSTRPFTDRDEAVLVRLAAHAALAIGNTQLFASEQRARAEAEVSGQRFVDLVQSLDAIVWEGEATASTCRVTFVSRSAETILGYPVERWLSDPDFMSERLHPDDREAALALCQAAVVEGRDHQFEYRMLAADGRVVWLHDTVRVVTDELGGARLLRGVKVDITELKRAAQHREIQFGVTRSLTDSATVEEALGKVLERICVELGWELGEFWRMDEGAERLRWSGCWHQDGFDVAGFTEASRGLALGPGQGLPGRAWTENRPVWISDIGAEAGFVRADLARQAGLHGAFAFPIRTLGRVVGVLVFFSRRVFPPDAHLLKMVADIGLRIGLDVERKQAEEAVVRSERRYRSLVEGAAYGICRVSLDGRFLTVNPALVAMLGYDSEEELLAASIERDIYHRREDRAPILDEYLRAGRVMGAEVVWRRKDGRVITVRLGGRALLDPRGEVESFEVIVEDVTERRALEEQLRQAQKMEAIGQLAGGVAHDFNNLLTVILGRSQILLDMLGSGHVARRDVELIHRTASRAAGLTRQLLAFGRKQVLQPEILDLNEVVAGMAALLRRLIGEHIVLVVDPGPGPHCVNADPNQLGQVVMNLAVNARDAMPHGGRLSITTSRVRDDCGRRAACGDACAGPCVLLSVTDTGVGMDAETRRRIFEPFFTTKGPGQGTGLGLATVYGIVTQSGGYVEVESESDRGTTFRIYLPSVEPAGQPTTPADPAPRERGTETILLVEDEEGVRELAREILARAGYVVLEAPHPSDALAVAERHAGAIHLLLTDVVMPTMSGGELATRVVERRPSTKVLYISGYAEGGVPGRAFLAKPFTPDTLLSKVREVLRDQPAS